MLKVRTMMFAAAVCADAVVAPATARAKYSVPYGSTALGDADLERDVGTGNGDGRQQRLQAEHRTSVPGGARARDARGRGIELGDARAAARQRRLLRVRLQLRRHVGLVEVWPFIGPRIDGLGHIERSAAELSSFVNSVLSKTKASKVDLVGHSQGGMMPNYYIKFLGGASKVNELIGLAPSNHGTTLDGLTKLVEVFPFADEIVSGLLEFLGAPSLPEQAEGSAFIKKLFGSGEPVVSGVRYVVIETEARRGRHALHQRVPQRVERDQHHHPEPVSERPGRAHRHVRRLAVAAERGQPAQLEPEPIVQSELHQLRPGHLAAGRCPRGHPARATRAGSRLREHHQMLARIEWLAPALPAL